VASDAAVARGIAPDLALVFGAASDARTTRDTTMTSLGTPNSDGAFRVLFLGAGELGKEVVIELQRLGVETIACDRYADAPAMQVAHRSHVLDMQDGAALRALIERERPQLVVPEIEAIATATLVELEAEGVAVVPSARAVHLTMNRNGIRTLAAETLGLPTSAYRFVDSLEGLRSAVAELGTPCVVKPSMSSSGKGQSLVRSAADVDGAWAFAREGSRGAADSLIVEAFVDFEYEITLLTVRHAGGTAFCEPIGHVQEDGDYRESWQPQPMAPLALTRARDMAGRITEALGGFGVFGVEFFVRGDDVWFSEVSPRPHDTGLVTLVTQDLSEFALHARAILGIPVPEVRTLGPGASAALLVEGTSQGPRYAGLEKALAEPGVDLRLFGKPEVKGRRRMGVALARGDDVDAARERARAVRDGIEVTLAF
jgi:phosphoribosylglycinamide formyltransferase 2